MEDGDSPRIETGLGQDNPELSIELMESIALEAVAAASISIIARDDARSDPWRFPQARAGPPS